MADEQQDKERGRFTQQQLFLYCCPAFVVVIEMRHLAGSGRGGTTTGRGRFRYGSVIVTQIPNKI